MTRLATEFLDSIHIEILELRGTTDREIWEYARDHGFIIISKDSDFRQWAFVIGPPPKVIWLAIGNADTQTIVALLRHRIQQIEAFMADPDEGLLILEQIN